MMIFSKDTVRSWSLWVLFLLVFVWISCIEDVADARPIPLSLLEQSGELQYFAGPRDADEDAEKQGGNSGKERELSDEVYLQPLRVLFDTTELDVDTWNSQPQLRDTIKLLKEQVLPDMESLLYETLSVVQRGKDIIHKYTWQPWKYQVPEDTCFGLIQNVDFSAGANGYVMDLEKHDLVIFILANSSNDPVLQCEDSTFAMSAPCMLYQSTDRPLIGLVSLCLDNLVAPTADSSSGQSLNFNNKRLEHTLLHEVTHNLGFNSDMFKYYRDPSTGQPLVQQPFLKAKQITCVQDRVLTNVELPTTVLQPLFENDQLKSFQITTPTVQQIVKIQFNCPYATHGGMLENQPTNPEDCFGSHWDERYHLYNSMSSIYDQESYFTPLTLAFLEDSGWYRANYKHPRVKISPFGLNAGCGFLTQSCLQPDTNSNNNIPSYSKGFFCDQLYDRTNYNKNWMCDANHSARGKCDLFPNLKSLIPNVGPTYESADHCPLVRMDLTDCKSPSNAIYSHNNANEIFGPTSSCIQLTNNNNDQTAICTTTVCNTQQRTVDITIEGNTISCQTDFQQITIPQHGLYNILTCPRISSVCPEMMTCPSQCSGKGTCDLKTFKCKCFDETDATEGCYNTQPLSFFDYNKKEQSELSEAWKELINMPLIRKTSNARSSRIGTITLLCTVITLSLFHSL